MAENKPFRIKLFLKFMSIGMGLPMNMSTEPASKVLLKRIILVIQPFDYLVRLSLPPYIIITCINQDIAS